MDNVKTKVWELEIFTNFGETFFQKYDNQRRKKEFELLKDLSRDFYKTNDILEDSIRIPVFNSDNEKEFTIQIRNTRHYYEVSVLFNHEEDISEYMNEFGSYKRYPQSLTEVEVYIYNFIWTMSKFLRNRDLYLREITREEQEKLINETIPAYHAFERGDLEK